MRMTHASMYARLLAGDPAYNGRFFTGVVTTGIYCLPSCRARKPKSENVRFFPTCEAARSAGLRACRKCHPDDFARGADPVLTDIEMLVGEIRADPAAFADARAVVQRSGFGATRLFELMRLHYHSTPADVLLRARVDAAKALLSAGQTDPFTLLEIAHAVGFESVSVLHEHFLRLNGLTPAAYRELGHTRSFILRLPTGYPLPYLRRALGRDPQSVSERLVGDSFEAAVRLPDGSATVVQLALAPDSVGVTVEAPELAREAHRIAVGWLGLAQDAAAFARLARKLGLGRLVAGRAEFRLTQTASVYDGLLWSILGQQINLSFASVLRRRLSELAGEQLRTDWYVPPTPAAVAALNPKDLLPLQFSRQKADYILSISRLIVEGRLNLDELPSTSASRVERNLLAVRGLGPWSVNYIMMRALNLPDCVPLGDTGLTSGLQALLELEHRPDADATRNLMAMFAPFRSLATAHLWQFNRPLPA